MVYVEAVAVGQPCLYSSQPDPARALGVALLQPFDIVLSQKKHTY